MLTQAKRDQTALMAGGVIAGLVVSKLVRWATGQSGFVMSDSWMETSVARGIGFTVAAMGLAVAVYAYGRPSLRKLFSNPAADIAPIMVLAVGFLGFLLSQATPYAVAGLGGPMKKEITGQISETNYESLSRGSCPAAIHVNPLKGPERYVCLIDQSLKRQILDTVWADKTRQATLVIEGWGNAAGLYPSSFTVRTE
jgi:hypothetical protein